MSGYNVSVQRLVLRTKGEGKALAWATVYVGGVGTFKDWCVLKKPTGELQAAPPMSRMGAEGKWYPIVSFDVELEGHVKAAILNAYADRVKSEGR